jgi:hypothetical protein
MRAFGGKYSGKQSLKLLVFEAKLIELESFPIAFNLFSFLLSINIELDRDALRSIIISH